MRNLSLALFCVVCATSSIVVAAEKAKPTPPAERRDAIQTELDRNYDAIHRMYTLLESIPAGEPENRRYVESQIEEFDARNNVLFEEIDDLDREQLRRHRKEQLKAHANRLSTKAARSDSTKSPAELVEAEMLENALAKDGWQEFLEGTWSEENDEENSGPIYLFVENVRLRAEVETLRKEVEALRKRTAELEARGK